MEKNPVVHFEMPYQDGPRMAKFYQTAFGWETNQLGKEMGNYIVVMTAESDKNGPLKPGSINGGFYKKPDDPFGHYPSFVISVPNLEEVMQRVTAAGGQIHGQPDDIPGVGRYVSCVDTEGNRVSLLQPLM